MARNTRGKLKENMEGIHRDCEWIRQHCQKSLAIIPDGYDNLQAGIENIVKLVDVLDEYTQKLYSRI